MLELKTIEYKESLPSNKDSDKKEFLADVSSFANAIGGDLVYGISEDRSTGLPERLEGLDIKNVDKEINRLDSIMRHGIEPRIMGTSLKPVDLSNSKTALIIKVPKSWISPHRVSFKGHDKFYSRSTNGKYPMDVAELRVAFNLSETIIERVRRFRNDRTSKIMSNETPVPFYSTAKIVLHFIPITSFHAAQSFEIDKIPSHTENIHKMGPMGRSGYNHRYNFDGFLTYSVDKRTGKSFSYTQLFRNGIIEAVEGSLLEPKNGELLIPGAVYEKWLIESLPKYLSVLRMLNVELPIFMFLTLLGVKGYSMAKRFWIHIDEVHRIDRDVLLLSEEIIKRYDISAKDVLRPCFDAIWNACGFPRSLNYDEAGEWIGR